MNSNEVVSDDNRNNLSYVIIGYSFTNIVKRDPYAEESPITGGCRLFGDLSL